MRVWNSPLGTLQGASELGGGTSSVRSSSSARVQHSHHSSTHGSRGSMETKTEPVLKLQYAKIVLVNPYPYYAYGINEATIYPPLGLAAIAAWLEQQGATGKIVDANIFHLRNDTVLKEIREFKPDLVGVQMNVVTAKAGIELCKLLKEQLRIPIAIGGPFTPDKIAKLLKDSSADFFVHGEGELTFAEICTGRPP